MKQRSTQTTALRASIPALPDLKIVTGSLFLFFAFLLAGNAAKAKYFIPTCSVPAITSVTSGAVCGFGSVTLTATASAGTVNWYNDGGTLLHTGTSYTATALTSTTTFYVDATDGSCTTPTRTAVTATVYERPVVTASASPSPACVGNSLSLSASASGGTTPYSYSWSGPDGFSTSASTSASAGISALTINGGGNYNLTVTDANGCTGSSSPLVSVYSNPSLDVVGSPNPVCIGNILSLSSGFNSGGTGVATYYWTGSNGYTGTSENPQLTDINTANAGIYSVTATDSHGCQGHGTTAAISVTTNSAYIAASSDVSICNGSSTTLTSSGGSTYEWNPGTGISPTTGSNVTANPTSTTTYTVTGHNGNCYNTAYVTVTVLPQYSVTATSGSNGSISGSTNVCSGTDMTYTITPTSGYHIEDVQVNGTSIGTTPPFTIHDISGPSTISATFVANCIAPSVSCAGDVTQGADAGACNAVVTYSDATVTGTSPTVTYSQNSGSTFPVGVTTVTITATNSCGTASCNFNVTVNPNTLSVSSTQTNVSCHGGSDGAITTNITGGTGSYSYSWTGGADGANPTALTAGAYSVTVTDIGCSGATAATAAVTITEPTAVSLTATATDATCFGGDNGSVSLTSSGGTGTITYSGAATTNLTAATYCYTATDSHGCTASQSATVGQPSAVSLTATAADATCYGGSNGSVSLSSSGGTGTITYSGAATTGLAAGTYSYTATDAQGCTATQSATVSQPTAVVLSATATNVSCYGGNNGSVSLSSSGGTGTITYSGAATAGLTAGTYSYIATDAGGCTATQSATVSQPAVLTVSLTPANVSCGATSNGNITASVSGGTSGYTYLWSNSQANATSTGLTTGTYSVTVTDAHSCTATGSATVSQSTTTTCTITGSTAVLGNVSQTYSGPSGLTSYSWTVSGGDHICDAKCHHNSAHTCGPGCDHYGVSCPANCHHHSGHTCTNNHTGDHHCNIYCHHNSGHTCTPACDHYGHSCTTACHHNSGHHCDHHHCGSAVISGSSTGSVVTVISPCCATTYTLTLTGTSSGGCPGSADMAVTVTPSATITVYSTLYTTGSGNHPGVSKSALASNIKVFNRHTAGARDGSQSHYASVWNSTTNQVTNATVSSPVSVNLGGGPAYQYTVTVPAYGHYLVVGQSNVSSTRCGGTTCTMYTAKRVGGHDDVDGDDHDRDDDDDDDITPCTNSVTRFHAILKDQTGKCTEADTHQEHGSLMLVISPMAIEFSDSVSYLPVVYESVEGDWDVSVSAEPPYGFYTDPPTELATSVTDSVMNAVQFAVIDTGSEWTFTQLTHRITHKGADRIAYSKPVMVNNRTNKPSEINVIPNPANDQIKIIMPEFEGKATIYIYNMLGQKVAEQPINVISGASVPMDISSLVPGVYLVTAKNNSGKASGRLIKNAR